MDIQDIAKEAFAVLGTGRQVAPFSGRHSDFELEDAYRITAAVRALRETRGERAVGRKIGFTNRTIWAEYNVHAPMWGYVYDRTVHDLPKEGMDVSVRDLAEPRIEPEIVFGLAAAPVPGMHKQALLGCIDWVAQPPKSLRVSEFRPSRGPRALTQFSTDQDRNTAVPLRSAVSGESCSLPSLTVAFGEGFRTPAFGADAS